jgi:hypothetical protein
MTYNDTNNSDSCSIRNSDNNCLKKEEVDLEACARRVLAMVLDEEAYVSTLAEDPVVGVSIEERQLRWNEMVSWQQGDGEAQRAFRHRLRTALSI